MCKSRYLPKINSYMFHYDVKDNQVLDVLQAVAENNVNSVTKSGLHIFTHCTYDTQGAINTLIETAIMNESLDVIVMLMEENIFTHDHYKKYVNINQNKDWIKEFILVTPETPTEVCNIIINKIKQANEPITGVSQDFILKLLKKYAEHLVSRYNTDYLQQVLYDSNVCLTAEKEFEFVQYCKTNLYQLIKDEFIKLNDCVFDAKDPRQTYEAYITKSLNVFCKL